MPICVQYPTVGCVVEYFDASALQIAIVLEEVGGKLRIMLPNRRESKLPSNRVLPWTSAPVHGFSSLARDDMVKLLEEIRKRREEKARSIDVDELWELAQGEVASAPASWFAEFEESSPDVDTVAAYGHALLACRTRFRFVPPNFEVYDEETVARREEERRKQEERDRIVCVGQPFLRLLWNVAHHRAELPAAQDQPQGEMADRLEAVLRRQMARPDDPDPLWPVLTKGIGEENLLPVQLLLAWGKIPPHYNFWFDRASFAQGDQWWRKQEKEATELVRKAEEADLPVNDLPFVSIDGETTFDIDDAFHLTRGEDGHMILTLALACPALNWPFGSKFDQLVFSRGTSIYLPEGDCHMLPEFMGTGAFSLLAGEARPALVLTQEIDADGAPVGDCTMAVCRVKLAANLRYRNCQAVLDGGDGGPAGEFADMLRLAAEFGRVRLAYRIACGAVSLERMEPHIELEGEGNDIRVHLQPGSRSSLAQNMVAEMMILASASAAIWAMHHGVAMVYRTQNVTLPREYAGVWHEPARMTEIMRAMIPSTLETQPLRHAALGLSCYAPMTSPLRRYADLLNEAQLISALAEAKPLFDKRALDSMLLVLHSNLEAAGQVQRFRPRYWKLLFFKQEGEERWWDGTVTEENENFVSVALPEYDIFLRGKRRLFDERVTRGSRVRVRLGKVNPLFNEIQIVEAESVDQCVGDMDIASNGDGVSEER